MRKNNFFNFSFNRSDLYFAGFLIIFVTIFNTINNYIDQNSKEYTYIKLPNDLNNKGIIYKKLDHNITLILYFNKNVSSNFIDYSNLHPVKINYSVFQNNKLLFTGNNIVDFLKEFKLKLVLDKNISKSLRNANQ